MAIQVNGTTVIDNSRRGVFQKVHPGGYTTFPSASTGDMIYDLAEKTIKVYTGSEWK